MNWTAVSSATLASKRTASAAGMDGGAGTSGSKRRRIQKNSTTEVTQSLADQTDTYAAEKLSDSFSVSHVLNLLVLGENQCVHKAVRRLDQLTWVSR